MKNRFLVATATLLITMQLTSAQDGKLQTKVYNVMRTFGSYEWGLKWDSKFEESVKGLNESDRIKRKMLRAGIRFPKGGSVMFNREKLKFSVTNTIDELDRIELLLQLMTQIADKSANVYFELIEVDGDMISDWFFVNTIKRDATELRTEVQKWIKSDRAEIVHSVAVAARSGQRAKIVSGEEFIFPTEYDSAIIPELVNLKDGAKATVGGVTPTAFETRDLGVTLEVDAVIGGVGDVIYLDLVAEVVELEGFENWSVESMTSKFQTKMPTFHSSKISTQLTVEHGRYHLLGTTKPMKAANPKRKNPTILQFLRVDVSSTAAWSVADGKAKK